MQCQAMTVFSFSECANADLALALHPLGEAPPSVVLHQECLRAARLDTVGCRPELRESLP